MIKVGKSMQQNTLSSKFVKTKHCDHKHI